MNDQANAPTPAPAPANSNTEPAGMAKIKKATDAAQPPVKILAVLENALNQMTFGQLESQAALSYLLHKRCEERYLESLSVEAKANASASPVPTNRAAPAPVDTQEKAEVAAPAEAAPEAPAVDTANA